MNHPADKERYFALSIDMLCMLAFDGRFIELNPAWERTLGFTFEEMKAKPFIEFVHPDDRDRTRAQNAAVRNGGQAVGFENRYLCKDGSYRWLRWNSTSDPEHGVIYAIARDVTAWRELDEERERLVDELRGALAEVKALRDIIPICSYCRKVRDDSDYWQSVEQYISTHTSSRFSHSVCPDCFQEHVEPQLR